MENLLIRTPPPTTSNCHFILLRDGAWTILPHIYVYNSGWLIFYGYIDNNGCCEFMCVMDRLRITKLAHFLPHIVVSSSSLVLLPEIWREHCCLIWDFHFIVTYSLNTRKLWVFPMIVVNFKRSIFDES